MENGQPLSSLQSHHVGVMAGGIARQSRTLACPPSPDPDTQCTHLHSHTMTTAMDPTPAGEAQAELIAEEVINQTAGLSLVVEDNESKDVTILLGKSGSGKSTLINLLGGNPLAAKKERGQMSLFAPESSAQLQSFHIGSSHSGCTTSPNKWVSSKTESANTDLGVIWDLPGFGDNRGAATALSNAILAQKVFDTAGRMKLVVVLTDLSILESRGEELLLVTEQLDALIYSQETLRSLEGCVSIVLTGTGPEREEGDIRETISALLDENRIMFSAHQKTILTLLRDAPVAFFPKPTRAGPLDAASQKGIQRQIEDTIIHSTRYTEGAVATFVVLPHSAKVTLLECERIIAFKIRVNIAKLKSLFLESIKAFCEGERGAVVGALDGLVAILQQGREAERENCGIKFAEQIISNIKSAYAFMKVDIPDGAEFALKKSVSSVEALRYIRKFSTCSCDSQKELALQNKEKVACGTELPQLESIVIAAVSVITIFKEKVKELPQSPESSGRCKQAVKALINDVAKEAIKEAVEKHMAELAPTLQDKRDAGAESSDAESSVSDEDEEVFSFKALGLKGSRWKSCAACSAASMITAAAAAAAYVSPESADSILTTYITVLSKFLGSN
eukprot:TRINITY_DN7710_c0_g2_i1.p1 TRINITY_DN7710_c0_g2~~TRINITY_DN7710_c0_g2_i1.p1  ORF type:complete len:620 (+),score=152.55 TRINITY_DN7710_c0_g2_i1:787-2646(+)